MAESVDMAASPRRRTLLGRPGPPDPGDPSGIVSPAQEISTGEVLASRTGEVEVVEHVHTGAFDRMAAQDSFAMDDATSEEAQVDPRFARAMNGVEPATELLDREMLASFTASQESLSEDALADALSLPGEPAAPTADVSTERVSRSLLAAALLDEVTVPTPLPVAGHTEPFEVGGFDLTLPQPPAPPKPSPAQAPAIQQTLSPTGSLPLSGTRAVGQAESNRPSTTPVPPQRLPSRAKPTPPPAPPRPSEEPARNDTANNLSSPSSSAPLSGVLASVPAATPEPRGSGSEPASQSSLADGESVSLPIVGLVVAGSGGLVAVLVAGVVAIGVMLLVVFLSRGSDPPEEPQALPPIEIVPVTAPVPTQEVVPEPEEPNPTRPRRPAPTSEPAPAPAEPVPVLAPEPEPELPPDDLDMPVPEPEKKGGLFGKKKKN
jgi:hypothetical protein